MDESVRLLVSALTGGLAGACLSLIVTLFREQNALKRAKIVQLSALKQELRLSLWLVGYNYARVSTKGLLYTGLTVIDNSNVARVLFGVESSLTINDDTKGGLMDYFQQVTYLNSLVNEQASLTPQYPHNTIPDRQGSCLGEILAICTPNDTYRQNDPEPSLRARIKRLLQALDAR